jgi:hypothetical protein
VVEDGRHTILELGLPHRRVKDVVIERLVGCCACRGEEADGADVGSQEELAPCCDNLSRVIHHHFSL